MCVQIYKRRFWMPFLTINIKVCKKGKTLFLLNIIVQKKEAKVPYVGRVCCLIKLQNYKMKKVKIEFSMDKPKVMKRIH